MKLMKIRLINWYHLSNETIDIDSSALLTGDNGSGKSTILDAISYAITTKEAFNKAANDNSSRRLEGYVRCKLGIEGQIYKRNESDVISYIGLQFYDEVKKSNLIIIVRMIARSERGVESSWIVERNNTLDNIQFIVDNKPSKDLRDVLGNNLKFIKTKSESKNKIKFELGRLDGTFFDLLHKTLAFRPVDKVSQFINDYVLQKKDINVTELREGINSIKKLEITIEEDFKKLDVLKNINLNHDQYQELIQEEKSQSILLDLLKKTLSEINKDKYISSIENYNMKIKKLKEGNKILDDKKTELTKTIMSLENNDSIKAYNKIADTVQNLENELVIKKQQKENFVIQIDLLKKLLKKLNLKHNNFNSNITDAFYRLNKKLDELTLEKASLNNEINELQNEYKKLDSKIRKLEKKEFTYNDNVLILKEAIEKEFIRLNIKSDVYIFCELLEINNELWRNAIEGYLNKQRFNLIIEPKYYDIASRVYDNLKNRKAFGVGIVNIKKIPEIKVLDNSLYKHISAKNNSLADKYLQHLLGNIICCETVIELKKYNKSITINGMKYAGHVLSRINSKICEIPFIGKNAIEKQLDLFKLKKNENEKNIKAINIEKKSIDLLLSEANNINRDFVINNINIINDIKSMENTISQLKSNMDLLKDDQNIVSFLESKNNFEAQLSSIKDKLEYNNNEISSLNKKSALDEDKFKRTIQDIENYKLSLKNFKSSNFADYTILQKKASELTTESQINLKCNKIIDFLANTKNNLNHYQNEIAKYQNEYLTTFENNFSIGIEHAQKYRDEYNRITTNDLISKKDDLRKIKETCELQFKSDFLSKMKNNIDDAESRFKKLNNTLKTLMFGDENYKFKVSPKRDRSSLYKMIKDETNMGESIFSASFEDKYREEIQDLFDKISSDDYGNENAYSDYSDYRNYLEYDIEIIKNGKNQLFSKINKEKSGGETQTPFYVIMAAAFNQVYNNDSIKIMMLDEAFDKMDNFRIKTMLEFFNKLKFQIILATPPQKAEVISDSVDTILAITKSNGTGTILNMTRALKEQ